MQGLIRSPFADVWTCDELPQGKSFKLLSYFIINTHPSHMPGEHWLALTLEEDCRTTFYDLFGFPKNFLRCSSSIFKFILDQNCKHVQYNTSQLQHELSSVCRHHFIFYLTHRAFSFKHSKVWICTLRM